MHVFPTRPYGTDAKPRKSEKTAFLPTANSSAQALHGDSGGESKLLAPVYVMCQQRVTSRHFSLVALGVLLGAVYVCILRQWRLHEVSHGYESQWPAEVEKAACNTTNEEASMWRPPVTALVGYSKRSRTSILDCYLRRNLVVRNPERGMLGRVIFVPEPGAEADLDWLAALVGAVDGYFMLGQARPVGLGGEKEVEKQMLNKAREKGKVIYLSGEKGENLPWQGQEEQLGSRNETLDAGGGAGLGLGPTGLVRAWELARAMAEANVQSRGTDSSSAGANVGGSPVADAKPDSSSKPMDDTLFIFISAQTIFIDPQAIPSLVRTRVAYPEYGMVLANVVNEPGLAWLHHRLGVIGAWRPEATPVVSAAGLQESKNETGRGKTKDRGAYPWRTSELPRWTAGDTPVQPAVVGYSSEQIEESTPTDFGGPITFKPPFRGHRWLPYFETDATGVLQRQRVPTLITEETLVQNGPGKWPWSAGAMALYSLLEDLEGEYGQADGNCASASLGTFRKRGLDRYKVPLWEIRWERLDLGFAALWGQDIRTVGGLREEFTKGSPKKWIEARLRKTGVVDGNAIAARFMGGAGVEAELEKLGLESTDILDRFGGFAGELGCRL